MAQAGMPADGIAELRQRAAPRPLDGTTNGHATTRNEESWASERLASAEKTSPRDELASSEEEPDDSTSTPERRRLKQQRHSTSRLDRARLRYSTPEELVAWSDARVLQHLTWYILAFRLLNAVITSRTVFAPDEHWQSLEIAHAFVFDNLGWRTWEWVDRRPADQSALGAHWGSGPIRSFIYPALFVPVYGLLRLLGLDSTALLTIMPSLLQGLMATITDVCTFKLAARIVDVPTAWATLLVSLSSMYTFHTTTRTLSNSLEATITACALTRWPLSIPLDPDADLLGSMPLVKARDLSIAVALFALSAALRPSNILLSVPLTLILLRQLARHVQSAGTALEAGFAILTVLYTIAIVGVMSLTSLMLLDTLYYGRLTLTPLAFLKRNVLDGISLFYGASPLHFYLSSAMPFIAFSTLPFALWGWTHCIRHPVVLDFDKKFRRWRGFRGENDPAALHALAQSMAIFIMAMSLLGHKEVRFLQPVVPIVHIFTGYAFIKLPRLSWFNLRRLARQVFYDSSALDDIEGDGTYDALETRHEGASRTKLHASLAAFTSWQGRLHLLPPSPSLQGHIGSLRKAISTICWRHGRLGLLMLWINVPALLYLCVHSSGQVKVANEVGKMSRNKRLESVGFLMPCHSTPWQSHMHAPRLANNLSWFITCEPPLDGQDRKTYQDESDIFYANPYKFLLNFDSGITAAPWPSHTWPSHLVLFEALLGVNAGAEEAVNGSTTPTVASLLFSRGYRISKAYWNSFYHLDARRRGQVMLLERSR